MTQTLFRYPGAKNKLLPVIMENLNPLLEKEKSFVDVFTGGGSVLLKVAKEYPDHTLYINDKDYWVYCFWKVVSSGDCSQLNNLLKLVGQTPTIDLFYKLREENTTDEVECAYRAVFFNRTTFSGIFNSGPIGGKDQKSKYKIDCRYNPKKLQDKILKCDELLANRSVVSNLDFSKLDVFVNKDIPAYCDPPYYIKGPSLYREVMMPCEHFELRNVLYNRKNWVLSYDDCPEIRNYYTDKPIVFLDARYCINGKKEKWEKKNELIILP